MQHIIHIKLIIMGCKHVTTLPGFVNKDYDCYINKDC